MKKTFTFRKLKTFVVLLFNMLFAAFAYSQKTPVKNLYEYKLSNGLTLFVSHNSSVPLAYIEIAVRAGALSQRPETAGLFHLYEHMMFKGNSLYPDAASVNRALSLLGVASWNGTTSVDRVNYFFTIPDSKLEDGLVFWSEAIRNPLMDEVEFENEKKVVLAEIEGDENNPARIYANYINQNMFCDAPWRTDAAGNPLAVRNATVNQLKEIQKEYYVPSNAALFVGGNVDPDETFHLVEKIFGDWEDTSTTVSSWKVQNEDPIKEAKYACLKYDMFPAGLGAIELRFRGPDTDFDLKDTYAADYLCQILNDPERIFRKTVAEDEYLNVPGVEYVYGNYLTVRANGAFSFGVQVLNPSENIADRSEYFKNLVKEKILPEILNDKNTFSSKTRKSIVSRLNDERLSDAQTASGLLSNLSFWWSKVNPDYYYDYIKNISKVSKKDVELFIEKYFTNEPLVTFIVNPQVELSSSGVQYEIISKENSLWYNNEYSKEYVDSLVTVSSLPREKSALKKYKKIRTREKSETEIKECSLKNGIPVFIKRDKNVGTASLAIGVKGGVSHLTPETSGLESALFSMMTMSSKSYGADERKSLEFQTGSSFGTICKLSGSAVTLDSLGKYFYKLVPVLTDGFLNPLFDDTSFNILQTELNRSLSSSLNDPSSLLLYTAKKELYKGHPFEADSSVTEDSIKNITVQNMQELHKKIIAGENIFIVASGNVNQNKLIKILNKTLGKLSFSKTDFKVPEIEGLKINAEEEFFISHPSAKGTGYAARVFAAPANTSEEYIPCVIASKIYSDVLFNVVREHYGACYTPSSFVIGSKAGFGMEYVFKISNLSDYKKYVSEARSYMAEGLSIKSLNDAGGYEFINQEDILEEYKNSYINETYAGNATSYGVLFTMTYNYMQFNDISYDRIQLKQVRDLSAEKVREVFNRYWLSNDSRWFIVSYK